MLDLDLLTNKATVSGSAMLFSGSWERGTMLIGRLQLPIPPTCISLPNDPVIYRRAIKRSALLGVLKYIYKNSLQKQHNRNKFKRTEKNAPNLWQIGFY